VARLARDASTLVVPGHFFDAPDHVRVALGVASDTLARGLQRITAALSAWHGSRT
jgi:aspartate/methionine/tyrosine aminotransferase